ncbi:MAG: nucleotidyltransferase domain-containing protein [Firmicutes bacterium]|nr:nucleotidyltransferase domain-containing protein [Bacillota bacterium]
MHSKDRLSTVADTDTIMMVERMTAAIVEHIHPLKVILFGSFAKGSYTEDSDYDIYLVVKGRNEYCGFDG